MCMQYMSHCILHDTTVQVLEAYLMLEQRNRTKQPNPCSTYTHWYLTLTSHFIDPTGIILYLRDEQAGHPRRHAIGECLDQQQQNDNLATTTQHAAYLEMTVGE